MEPTITRGDLIVVTPPPTTIEPGMILTMGVEGRIVTHRVVSVGTDGSLVTRGDANAVNDDWHGERITIYGQYLFTIPRSADSCRSTTHRVPRSSPGKTATQRIEVGHWTIAGPDPGLRSTSRADASADAGADSRRAIAGGAHAGRAHARGADPGPAHARRPDAHADRVRDATAPGDRSAPAYRAAHSDAAARPRAHPLRSCRRQAALPGGDVDTPTGGPYFDRAALRAGGLARIARASPGRRRSPACRSSGRSRTSTSRSSASRSTPASPTASAAGSARTPSAPPSVMLRPYNPNLDVKPFEVLSCVDYGDVAIVPGYTERCYAAIEAAVAPIVEAGVVPLLDRRRPRLHAAAPPGDPLARPGRGHRLRLAHRRLGLVLRGEVQPRDVDAPGDRGGPRRRRPLDRGRPARLALRPRRLDRACESELGLDYLTTEQVLAARRRRRPPRRSGNGSAIGRRSSASTSTSWTRPSRPGTGTPEPGGLSAHDVLAIVRALTGIDFVGFDVVEVIPAYDPAGQTAFLAANLAYEMLSLVALRRAVA